MTPAGAGYCWGLNSHGQLGKGGTVTQASRDSVPQPVAMPGAAFARMYAGKYHTCAISTAGDAYCWGRNDFGQLGDGNRTNFNTGNPVPVAVAGGVKFRSLSLGELYTCGVAADLGSPTGPSASAGTIYCWGDNIFGQIGSGQAAGGNAPVLTPTRVAFQP
jgi:alpha-tubulin suppressor-like RCC1 family protein